MKAIEFIERLDAWAFLDYVDNTKATICGSKAIACFIIACKMLGAKEVRLENYYGSGDLTNDWSNSVGYGSIVVK